MDSMTLPKNTSVPPNTKRNQLALPNTSGASLPANTVQRQTFTHPIKSQGRK